MIDNNLFLITLNSKTLNKTYNNYSKNYNNKYYSSNDFNYFDINENTLKIYTNYICIWINGLIYNIDEIINNLKIYDVNINDINNAIIYLYKNYGFEYSIKMLYGDFNIILLEQFPDKDYKLFTYNTLLSNNYIYILKINDLYAISNDYITLDKYRENFEISTAYTINNNNLLNIETIENGLYIQFKIHNLINSQWYINKKIKINNINNNIINDNSINWNYIIDNIKYYISMSISKRIETIIKYNNHFKIICILNDNIPNYILCYFIKKIYPNIILHTYSLYNNNINEKIKLFTEKIASIHTYINANNNDNIDMDKLVYYNIKSNYISDCKYYIFNTNGINELFNDNNNNNIFNYDYNIHKKLKNIIYNKNNNYNYNYYYDKNIYFISPYLDINWINFYMSIPIIYRFNTSNIGNNNIILKQNNNIYSILIKVFIGINIELTYFLK